MATGIITEHNAIVNPSEIVNVYVVEYPKGDTYPESIFKIGVKLRTGDTHIVKTLEGDSYRTEAGRVIKEIASDLWGTPKQY